MSKAVTRRGESKPPKDLKALISVANRRDLPDATALFGTPDRRSRIAKLLRSLSSAEREFLGSPNDELEFRRQYDAFETARLFLPAIADQNSGSESRSDYDMTDQFTSLPSIPMNLYVRGGRISASGNFFNVIEGIPADHVRRCAICRKLFWASRINSPCCSVKHRKQWNKRNSRRLRKDLDAGKPSKDRTQAK